MQQNSLRRFVPLAAALLGTAAFAGPAQAVGIGTHGPLDADFGNYPAWYEDAIGQRLEPCLDGPQCLASIERPDPAAPVSFPDNFPVEQFWFEADTTIGDVLNPQAIYVAGQEGAFGGASEGVVDGEQVAFGRIRIRVFNGLTVGKSYRVTHPYGVQEFVAAEPPRQINFTDDTGCLTLPCDLADYALLGASNVGPNFLQWDTRVSMPPAGFIGDSTVEHEVVGSPLGTNYFRVEELSGPGGAPVRTAIESKKFLVQGKLAPGAARVGWLSAPQSSDAGGVLLGESSASKTVTIANSGGGPLSVSSVVLGGANAGDFAANTGACPATLAPGAGCDVTYTFTPQAAGARTATVTVTTNLGTQVVELTGKGTEPAPPPAPPATQSAVVTQPLPIVAAPNRTLRAASLKAARRISRRSARRTGLLVSFRMPAAAKTARVSLYRGSTLVQRKSLTGSGAKSLRFKRSLKPGLYVIKVQVGPSASALGPVSLTRVRVVR